MSKNLTTRSEDYSKWYNELVVKTEAAAIIFRIEQRFSLPDKDILYYTIFGLLFLFAFVHNVYPQYFPKLFSQVGSL